MKDQDHINNKTFPGWYCCKQVEFGGETATWELSQTGRYSFIEAYQKTPHRQLVKASTDQQLRAFVKAWGPLRGRLDGWSGKDSIETYRKERDRLVAAVGLLASVAEPQYQRDSLLEWVKISAWDMPSEIVLAGLRTLFPIPGEYSGVFDTELEQWIERATVRELQAATEYLVASLPIRTQDAGYEVERHRRSRVLRACLKIASLTDALHWMVWQDVFQERRFQFCDECRVLFQPDTRHTKKFCSPECAHRKTARESARRRRKED